MLVAGIELEPEGDGPYHIKSRGWIVHPYRVSKDRPVTRDELSALIGETVNDRVIVAVESYAVEAQAGKVIGLAFKAEPQTE